MFATCLLLSVHGCKEEVSKPSVEQLLLDKKPSKYWSDSPESIKKVEAPASNESTTSESTPTQSTSERVVPERPARACSVEKIQSVVRPHKDEIVRCYRKAVYKNPSLKGRLVVEMHIDKMGRSRFLGVTEDSLKAEDVTRCIFGVLKQLAYPIPDKNACVVLYPFVFSASPPQ